MNVRLAAVCSSRWIFRCGRICGWIRGLFPVRLAFRALGSEQTAERERVKDRDGWRMRK